MKKASSRPTLTLYPGDELRSPIMMCSLATHGLYIRLLLLAHDCERPGILSHLGEPITHELIARRCGTTLEAMLPALAEITRAGLVVTDSQGFYVIPSMVNHEKKKAEWRRNKEKKMGKNRRFTVEKESQENLKRISKESTPLSFSFSSSDQNQELVIQNQEEKPKDTPPLPPRPKPPDHEIPEDLSGNASEIREWLDYKRERGQGYKPRGIAALWAILRAMPMDLRGDAIRQSMASNYAGIFPPKGGSSNGQNRSVGLATPTPGKYAHLSQ